MFMKNFRSQMPGIFCLFLIAFTTNIFADGPSWTHKPAQDIKWYEMTDVGTLLVGTAGNL